MSSDVVSKLSDMDYNFISATKIKNFPSELIPTAITDDGIFIETLPSNEKLIDGLFIAFGKLITLKKYIQDKNLTSKYSILLLLSSTEFKKLHPELRKSIYTDIPIIIV